MPVTIQDDMLAAAEMLPGDQGARLIMALVSYGIDGDEPDPSEAWYPLFVVCRARVEMSARASERGRRMADAKRARRSAAQAGTQVHTQEDTQVHTQEDTQVHTQADTQVANLVEESRGEERREKDSRPAPGGRDAGRRDGEAVRRVIGRLNERAHRSFRPDAPKSASIVGARLRDGYTERQLMHVVDVKCEEWLGTEHEAYLRPETLFAPSHIESYVNQPMRARERASPRPGEYGIEGDDPFAAPAGALVVGGGAS
ncbi:conserved phage C-terminal domain-containing protein [Olsenella uli]|uniref:conserved phage C-terminal domain-containing protein n=1 Tax=Olsenella uli TaxID=133926 RepID=UPI0024A9D380|nr:conserved phage C-terminal domain-containing protein [Olsenella uli]